MANTQSNEKQGSGSQGFASMDSEKQKEIASQGGKASHSGSSENSSGSSGSESKSGNQGGSSEQHAQAGSQSHKSQ